MRVYNYKNKKEREPREDINGKEGGKESFVIKGEEAKRGMKIKVKRCKEAQIKQIEKGKRVKEVNKQVCKNWIEETRKRSERWNVGGK